MTAIAWAIFLAAMIKAASGASDDQDLFFGALLLLAFAGLIVTTILELIA